jgi:deoxyribodipyrimidine photo-lyase
LAALPTKYLHAPWTAPSAVLRHAGLKLGADYPVPIVDHAAARLRALDAFSVLKSGKPGPLHRSSGARA